MDVLFETDRRLKNMKIVAGAMIVGFLLPVVIMMPFMDKAHVEFIGFTALYASMPFVVRIVLLLPLMAGIVLLAMKNGAARNRGVALMVLGALPTIISVFSRDAMEASMGLLGAFPVAGVSMLLAVLAWTCLLAGVRSSYYRPSGQGAFLTSKIGAIAFLALLVVPVLPKENGFMIIVMLFKMMTMIRGFASFVMIASILTIVGCWGTASVCLLLRKTSESDEQLEATSEKANKLVVLGGLIPLGVILLMAVSMSRGMRFTMFMMMAKQTLTTIGIAVLIPMGITELLIGDSPVEMAPEADDGLADVEPAQA